MDQNLHDLFCSLTKGKINFLDLYTVEWVLGDMILLIYLNSEQTAMEICWKKHNRNLTHIHLDYEDLERYVKEIDNPDKKICVKNLILVNTFKIIDGDKAKKQTIFRHYSI